MIQRSRSMRVIVIAQAMAALICAASVYAAKNSLAQAERSFLEGRYDDAVSEADALIKSRSGHADEAYYIKGLSELKLKRFEDARRSFDTIKLRYPYSKRLFDAYLGMGDSCMLEGDSAGALGAYNEMAAKFVGDKNTPLIYHRLGDCYEKLGLKEKAAEYRNKAKSASPMSFESQPAYGAQKSGSISDTGKIRSAPEYSVQIGSFKNKRNAEKLARDLSCKGYEARVDMPLGGGDGLYKVRVGKSASRQQAENIASRLNMEGCNTRICSDGVCE